MQNKISSTIAPSMGQMSESSRFLFDLVETLGRNTNHNFLPVRIIAPLHFERLGHVFQPARFNIFEWLNKK